MIDIAKLRADPQGIAAKLRARGFWFDVAMFVRADQLHRDICTLLDEQRAEKNCIAKRIGQRKREGLAVVELIEQSEAAQALIDEFEPNREKFKAALDKLIADMPNIPHESVPGAYRATTQGE